MELIDQMVMKQNGYYSKIHKKLWKMKHINGVVLICKLFSFNLIKVNKYILKIRIVLNCMYIVKNFLFFFFMKYQIK